MAMISVFFSLSEISGAVTLSPRETFTCEFFVEQGLADFDEERERKRQKKRSRCSLVHLENAMSATARFRFLWESRDSSTRSTAWVSHLSTSGYLKRRKESWKDTHLRVQSKQRQKYAKIPQTFFLMSLL
jgi:hypothetical protein